MRLLTSSPLFKVCTPTFRHSLICAANLGGRIKCFRNAVACYSQETISDVYRLHHVPTSAVTINSLTELLPTSPSMEHTSWQQWLGENEQKIISSVQFLHREVPIRLARRIVDLESLPGGLGSNSHILQLRELLLESFDELVRFPLPSTLDQEREYMKLQMDIRERHVQMQDHVSTALAELSADANVPEGLDDALNRFYESRITLRLMIDQHLAVQKFRPGFNGIIANECFPVQVIRGVIPRAQKWCLSRYGVSPQVNMQGGAEVNFKYIPEHVELIVAELLKYSMQRVATKFRSKMYPAIDIRIAGGPTGITIRVSDQGGGISFKHIDSLWSYLQRSRDHASDLYDPVSSTLDVRVGSEDDGRKSNNSSQVKMGHAGGLGLPIARLHARYFGGDMTIMPLEGYGTDAFVHLFKLAEDHRLV